VQVIAKAGAVTSGIAGTVWVVWTTWVLLVGGTVPLFGWEVAPNPLGAILFLVFGEPIAMTLIYWAWLLVAVPLGLIFRQGPATYLSDLDAPELVRHVSLYNDGLGATFYLFRNVDGRHRWQWSYDHGVPDDLNTSLATHLAITDIEKELNLPLTYPQHDPNRPKARKKPPTPEEREAKLRELEDKAAGGDLVAKVRLWGMQGEPVTQPEALRLGYYYHVGFDIARYVGSFEGRRWDGFPDLEDDEENVHNIWYKFDASECAPEDVGKGGVRFTKSDFMPRGVEGDEAKYSVSEIPAPVEEIQETFEKCRQRYQEWLRSRPEDRYF
jgi:hypothetical protein